MAIAFEIKRNDIRDAVDAEVSKVADKEYDDDGNSGYDGVIFSSSDFAMLDEFIEDAEIAFQKRLADVSQLSLGVDAGDRFTFQLPDFDESQSAAAEISLKRFIVLNVCAAWFQHALPGRAEEYAARGQVAMDKAVAILLHRDSPKITRL